MTQLSDTLGLLDAWGRCVCAHVRMCRRVRARVCVDGRRLTARISQLPGS